jgi:hypothetical protein
VDLARQSIERRDFPIARRGYEPATVDAHLSAVAAEVQALREELQQGGGESLALAAGSQVQGILQAAEATAAEIVRQAQQNAKQTMEEADRDAAQTRADAIARAEAHVEAVSSASGALLSKVESLDGEVDGLVQSVRAGAGRLSGDLAALGASMGALYDASAGVAAAEQAPSGTPVQPSTATGAGALGVAATGPPATGAPATGAPATGAPAVDPGAPTNDAVVVASGSREGESAIGGGTRSAVPASAPAEPLAESLPLPAAAPAPPIPPAGGVSEHRPRVSNDLDSARLIALNMALNGDPREATSQYLADHFQLTDRQQLIDEVYAAIEG